MLDKVLYIQSSTQLRLPNPDGLLWQQILFVGVIIAVVAYFFAMLCAVFLMPMGWSRGYSIFADFPWL